MREIIINQRGQNSQLVRENQLLRKQNGRLRSALRHHCSQCAAAQQCEERNKLVQAALGEAIP